MTQRNLTITALHFQQGGRLLGTGYTVTADSTLQEAVDAGIIQMGRLRTFGSGLPMRAQVVLGMGLGMTLTLAEDGRFFWLGQTTLPPMPVCLFNPHPAAG